MAVLRWGVNASSPFGFDGTQYAQMWQPQATAGGDVQITVQSTNVPSRAQLRVMLYQFLAVLDGMNQGLT